MSQININNEPSAEVIIDENGTPVTVIIATSGASGAVWGSITGTLSDQTDLQNALDAKVPYSGATANVNLGEYGISTGYVQLDTTPTTYTPAVGNLGYNDTVGTLETTLKGGTVQLKIGRDMFERVVNKTGVQLTKAAYQAVRVSDAQGQRLAVALAQANNDNNSADTIGLAVETIAINQEGNIFTVGEITGINTTGSLQGETWADGDVLYLSPTVAGRVSNVKPVAPQHLVIIGYVVYAHANNGKIYVKVMNGWELGELHDVDTTGATAGQVLKYNGTIWAPSADAGITGSGNTDYVAKFTGTGTIGNSVIRVSGTDATYFSTNKAASSDGNNIFIGGGGQLLTGIVGDSTGSSYNVALGINSLLANTEGSQNSAIGYNALTSNTTGTQNSALGYQSLASNIQGFRNTSVGYFSLFSNSSGYNNTSVGSNSLFSNNSSGNSAFGVSSLFLNTNGYDNSAFGENSLYNNLTGNENLSAGKNSLLANTSGNRNVALGYSAGSSNTTGSNNIFLGSNSTGASITESNRTWIGNSSTTSTWLGGNLLLGTTTDVGTSILTMSSTSKGFLRPRMTTVQRDAIVSPATGLSIYNTTTNKVNYYNGTAWTEIQDTITNPVTGTGISGQVSYWSGPNTQAGSNNLFWDNANGRLGIGTNSPSFALQVQSDAQINGVRVGLGGGSVSSNTIVGSNSGGAITTGSNNTFVGVNSGQNNTASNNTFFGSNAGRDTTTSGGNAFFGYLSGINNTTGSNSCFFGSNSGRFTSSGGNLSILNQSVLIGAETRANASSETNQIAIGYNAIGLGSNTTVIGNSSTTFGRWWGNLLVGSSVNGGQALQITGLSSFTGTTASDGGQLGSELLSASGWTSTGWTGSFGAGYTHTVGNTNVLSNTLAAVNGTYYQIQWTVTGRTAGTFTIAFGGYSAAGQALSAFAGPLATSTGTLQITPTSDFDGTIVISIKVISASTASIQLRNSSGTITNEIRNNSLTSNTFIGLNAGSKNLGTTVTVESTRNTAVGSDSLQNNTTGSFNSAFGNRSLQTNTWGQYNNAFGASALQNNLTGAYNNAFGYQALLNNTTGSVNCAFGWEALKNSNVDNNSAFGRQALATTTGGRNSGFGSQVLFNLTTGANNAAFGALALLNLTTSSNVVALGDSAGRFTSTGSNLLTADNSTFIGQDSRPNADAETNQIVIGYQGRGLGSNTTVIGNSSTTFGRWWGNLLVGSSVNSGQALQVTGTSLLTGSATVTGSTTASSGVARGQNITSTLVASANNDVLVGLDINPTFTNGAFTGVTNTALRITGNTTTSGTLNASNTLDSFYTHQFTNLSTGTSAVVRFLLQSSDGGGAALAIERYGTGYSGTGIRSATRSGILAGGSGLGLAAAQSLGDIRFYIAGIASTDEKLRISATNGNLLINTTTDAGFKLDVNGTARVQDNLTISKDQNNATIQEISNTTSGTNSEVGLRLISSNGRMIIGKYSATKTVYKTIASNDTFIYNNTSGDISILNDASGRIKFTTSGATVFNWSIDSNGNLEANDAENIIFGTTTGTKIGTATSQKLAFWNATPIVQPTTGVASATRVGGAGTTVTDTDTFDGYTLAQIVKALRNTGILA